VRVEHKTGTLNGLTTDVGFITMPDGRRVALALFARGGTDRPNSIAQAARTIYDGFLRLVPDRLAPMPDISFGGGR
jgi:beta-lactamase class A